MVPPPPVTHVTNITPPVNNVVGPSLVTGPPNIEGSSPTISGKEQLKHVRV